MCRTEIDTLLRVLDEWEAAEDWANEAVARLSRSTGLGKIERDEVRALQRQAGQKLEALRKLMTLDVEPSAL